MICTRQILLFLKKLMNIKYFLLFFLFIFCFRTARAQDQTFVVTGTVIDSASGAPLQQVSVFQPASGNGTLTDENGYYTFVANRSGNIRFSYLGYRNYNLSVITLSGEPHVNIRMVILPFFIPELSITTRKMYKLDSLTYRLQNEEIFAARRQKSATIFAPTGESYSAGIGYSPSRLISNFFDARTRRFRSYRKTLEKSEKSTYISSRYNSAIVKGVTGLSGTELAKFAEDNEPTFDWLQHKTDYDVDAYIKEKYNKYNARLKK